MSIRKFTDITNETAPKYDRYKNTQIKATIEDVFDTGSALNSPNDAAIQFLKEKLDDIIDENNDKIVGKQPVFVDTTQTLTGAKFFGTSTKLHFRDSGIYLNSNTDGTLQIVADNKVNIYGKANFVNSAITASGNISASGDVTANAFIGDGSSLTSLPSQTDNNFTTTLKNKLDGISAGADVTPSWVPSVNPNYLTSVNASDVGLGNVTNESKATMFTNAALTGNPTAPTQTANDDSTKIATTAYVQQELTDLIGTAPAALDTLGELSASLAADQTGLASLTTTVGTKLAKSSNLSDLTNAETARTNLGLGSAATNDSGDFAAASHTHAASDITSGTFGASRIPNLAASKITTGTLATGRISEASVTQHEGALTITEAQISDLGTYSTATGVEDNANNYSLPAAASGTRDGVKIGYSENGKNYPVELSSEKMFVNVPWTDTNTTYTVGDGGLTQNNFTDALKTKLDGISTSADVTDATTVAAAGALMDSEVTNLAQVKAFDSSDYATAAQGTTADNALPKAGGTVTGTLNLNSSVNMNGTNDNSTYFAQGNYVEFSNDYLSRNQGNEFLYADRWATTNITGTFSYGSTNVFRPGDNFAAFVSSTGTNNPVSWEVLTSVTATTNVSARRVAIFAHGGFSCDLRIQVKKSDSTYADIYNDSYTFNGSRWHLFALTGISYPSDWNILGIKVTIDNYGTTTRYIGQIGITNTRNYNTTPYIFRGGGNLYDNSTLSFGNGTDLQIYHDGSNSYIDETGTGNLKIRSNRLQLEKYTGETMAEFIADGASSLYYDNSKKLETTSTGVEVTGNVVVSGTVDGRDIATDGTKLDGIESNATADQTGAEIKTALFNESDTNNLTDTLLSKLNGVEASADVTDTTNVTAAGALMDSELTDLAGIKSLNTSTLQVKPSEGAFANGDKTKLDGIATGADVTPAWVPSVDPRYLTNTDLTRDVSNTLPIANGGTGATTAGAALTALGAAASNHNHDASDINSGTLAEARIPDDMDSGKVKQICTTHHNFFMNSTSTTADFFVPFNNLNESSNPTNVQYYNRTVAPYGGRLVKIALHTTAAIGSACKAQFWIANSSGVFASYTEEVTGIDLNTANTSDTATFSSATFSEGDVIGVSIIKSTTATANMQVTLVWEYTL